MLKLHALLYRLTGLYSSYALRAEYAHLQTRWMYIQETYDQMRFQLAADDDFPASIDFLVGLEIGSWQVKHGFYRKFRI